MTTARLLIFTLFALGVFGFAQAEPPPNALDWGGVMDRIAQSERVVLLSVDGVDRELMELLTQLGYGGVRVYLLTNEQGDKVERLRRSGAVILGSYAGFFAIVDGSIFTYMSEYEAYIETPSPALARLYLDRFGIELEEEL